MLPRHIGIMKKTFRRLHRLSAVVLGVFTVLHLANHVVAVGGIASHIAVMSALRVLYRNPVSEIILVLAVLIQIVTGFSGLRNAFKRNGVARVQALSGLVLAVFLFGHTVAVIGARIALGLDTNFYFAATVFNFAWLPWFFIPYYFLAILSVAVHVGAALYWRSKSTKTEMSAGMRRWFLIAPIIIAVMIFIPIVLAFTGAFYPIHLPAEYTAPYAALQ